MPSIHSLPLSEARLRQSRLITVTGGTAALPSHAGCASHMANCMCARMFTGYVIVSTYLHTSTEECAPCLRERFPVLKPCLILSRVIARPVVAWLLQMRGCKRSPASRRRRSQRLCSSLATAAPGPCILRCSRCGRAIALRTRDTCRVPSAAARSSPPRSYAPQHRWPAGCRGMAPRHVTQSSAHHMPHQLRHVHAAGLATAPRSAAARPRCRSRTFRLAGATATFFVVWRPPARWSCA